MKQGRQPGKGDGSSDAPATIVGVQSTAPVRRGPTRKEKTPMRRGSAPQKGDAPMRRGRIPGRGPNAAEPRTQLHCGSLRRCSSGARRRPRLGILRRGTCFALSASPGRGDAGACVTAARSGVTAVASPRYGQSPHLGSLGSPVRSCIATPHGSVGHGWGLTPDTARMSWPCGGSWNEMPLIISWDTSIPARSGV